MLRCLLRHVNEIGLRPEVLRPEGPVFVLDIVWGQLNSGANIVDDDDWVFSRFLTKPFFCRKVYTNESIHAGDIIQVTKTVLLRDQDYWGEDAYEFRPESWDGLGPFWNFVPFGGPSAQMMVTTESSCMLAHLAQIYARSSPTTLRRTRRMRVCPSNKTGVQITLYK
ncbi:hypothetical protein VTN96DRAFT_8484 [Rasamsonia emersonii]